MKTKNKKRFFLIPFLLLGTLSINAQTEKYYAAFIYQFINYIEWPNKSDVFIIGTIGNSPVNPYLVQFSKEKKAGSSEIVVKEWNTIESIGQCNILFVPESEKNNLSVIAKKVENKAVLIVSESPNTIKSGANISFVKVEGKIKFDLNKTSITKMGLNVLSALEKFAMNVI